MAINNSVGIFDHKEAQANVQQDVHVANIMQCSTRVYGSLILITFLFPKADRQHNFASDSILDHSSVHF